MELVPRAQVYVVIPAYNEGTVLSRVVTEVKRAGYALRYVEQPVTIEYTAYSLAKGQNAVLILLDLFARRLYR
jgi:hypothetical protein